MGYKSWAPVQGEEVQVTFPCGYIEVARFVKDNGDGTGDCRVGRKRVTFANKDIQENWNIYKKVKEEKEEKVKKPRRDEDYDYYADKYES